MQDLLRRLARSVIFGLAAFVGVSLALGGGYRLASILLMGSSMTLLVTTLSLRRQGAEVVGITPSKSFVPPTMNLDGPKQRPPDEIETAPLEFERPVFDYIGESKYARRRREGDERLAALRGQHCSHEEHGEQELGSLHEWCLRCGVELEEKTLYDGRMKWVPVRGPRGCTHPNPEWVRLSDGTLVAWICTACNVDGRFPWPNPAS